MKWVLELDAHRGPLTQQQLQEQHIWSISHGWAADLTPVTGLFHWFLFHRGNKTMKQEMMAQPSPGVKEFPSTPYATNKRQPWKRGIMSRNRIGPGLIWCVCLILLDQAEGRKNWLFTEKYTPIFRAGLLDWISQELFPWPLCSSEVEHN